MRGHRVGMPPRLGGRGRERGRSEFDVLGPGVGGCSGKEEEDKLEDGYRVVSSSSCDERVLVVQVSNSVIQHPLRSRGPPGSPRKLPVPVIPITRGGGGLRFKG